VEYSALCVLGTMSGCGSRENGAYGCHSYDINAGALFLFILFVVVVWYQLSRSKECMEASTRYFEHRNDSVSAETDGNSVNSEPEEGQVIRISVM
jgi:hypothetical protein